MTTNNETAISDSLSAAPDVPWATAALDLVLSEENRPVANHSVRSWAFARLLRDHLDLVGEVDEPLLFAGTVLHDIGLRRGARKPVRFRLLMLPDAGHGAQSQQAELFLANARLLLNSGN